MAPEFPAKDTIAVVGMGYIGLPTAVILALNGLRVVGVDVSDRVIDLINQGVLPIVEAGMDEPFQRAVRSGNLAAQAEMPPAATYIIAVPTPFQQDYQADLSYIFAAAEAVAAKLSGGELVVLESTSPPGTTEQMAEFICRLRPDVADSLHFAHAPERVLPGRIMVELVQNDRVIGGLTPHATELAKDLYASFCRGELSGTDARTAEMTKLTENAFRDVNIAFANELSLIAERLDIDVWELIDLANRHPRVNILQPGPGVGGHCIAVDPWFIVGAAPEESRLIKTARQVNDAKPEWVVAQVEQALAAAKTVETAKVAVLGLAFKADIDDLRGSPAVEITARLANENPSTQFLVVEPNIDYLPPQLEGKANLRLTALDQAIAGCDSVLLLADHREFRELPTEALAGKLVIDTKGIWRDAAGGMAL